MDNSRGKILWVDDEIDHLKPHILFLEDKGFSISTASNGADAVTLIKESNFQILSEIILQLIVITIVWYFLHGFLSRYLEHLLNVKMGEATKSGIDLVSAITLIGLQKNLIDKLEYITHEHPFRLSDFNLP